MTFHVGQRVVCVDDSDPLDPRKRFGGEWCPHGPRRNSIYTVRDIVPCQYTGHPYLRMVEIVNPPRQFYEGFIEPAFEGRRFRPIVERKTDISIFAKLLAPTKQRAMEDVR